MMRALVVGATSWGCTLAIQLDRAGSEAVVLCRTTEEANTLASERENRRLLPGIALPESIRFCANLQAVLPVDIVIFAVPSQQVRQTAQTVLAALPSPLPILVSGSKGLDATTNQRMSQVLAEEAAALGATPTILVLSGPNIAREIALGHSATTVIAGGDAEQAAEARDMLMSPSFRVYTNADLVGVELGGALKNVVAIGAGIGDALNVGENGQAAFLTRGLAEMARLGAALGASPLTFAGLACLGDLIVTASSRRSRNRHVGEELGLGRPLDEILAGMVHVAEGIDTTRAARSLAREADVDMPIVDAVYGVLFEGARPIDAIATLMTREAQDELAGLPGIFSL